MGSCLTGKTIHLVRDGFKIKKGARRGERLFVDQVIVLIRIVNVVLSGRQLHVGRAA